MNFDNEQYEKEVKALLLNKDISSLEASMFDNQKIMIDAKRKLALTEQKIKEIQENLEIKKMEREELI